MQQSVDHLDTIAREADDALDVILGGVARQSEDRHVAALRLRAKDAARKQGQRKRQRIAAVAIAELRNKQIISDQQRALHRTRWNIERLEQERPDHERDQESLNDHAACFSQVALFALFLSIDMHWALIGVRGGAELAQSDRYTMCPVRARYGRWRLPRSWRRVAVDESPATQLANHTSSRRRQAAAAPSGLRHVPAAQDRSGA